MRYTLIGLGAILFYLACSDTTSSNNGNDENTDQTSDPADGGDAGALWADAWSILGTRCGSPGSCHNMSNDGAHGVNLPSDDETLAKTNAINIKDEIRSEVASGGMPKDGTLTEDERAKVIEWVDSL